MKNIKEEGARLLGLILTLRRTRVFTPAAQSSMLNYTHHDSQGQDRSKKYFEIFQDLKIESLSAWYDSY